MHFINRSSRARWLRAALVATVAGSLAAAAGVTSANGTTRAVRSVVLVGHGWGPGLGMGQWGDFGYAVVYHDTYSQILSHFYGGTTLGTLAALGRPADPTIRVLILENLNLKTNVGFDPVLTSPSAFVLASSSTSSGSSSLPGVTGASGASGVSTNSGAAGVSGASGVLGSSSGTATSGSSGAAASSGVSGALGNTSASGASGVTGPVTGAPSASGGLTVPAGSAVDLRLQKDGTWSAFLGTSCAAASSDGTPAVTGLVNPVASPASNAPTAPRSELLTLCRHDGVDEVLRGQIEAYARSGYERTLNLLPLDSYLEGVVPAEESASWGTDGGTVGAPQGQAWGFQALEAQAVAARSYTLAYGASGGWNGYADICDTDVCEAYVGATYEYATSDAAVADTTGQVLLGASSAQIVVEARFSASTGGWTAAGDFPSVSDLGDTCVVPGNPLQCNPNHTWSQTVSAAAIDWHYPRIGKLVTVRVTKRNHEGNLGGRALVVLLKGTRGEVKVGGGAFAAALGLRSDWFAVSRVLRGAPVTTTTTLAPVPGGATGPSGVSGASGASGASGVLGASGASGPSGATGVLGTTGATGAAPTG